MKLVAVKDSEDLLHHVAYWTALASVNLLATALVLVKTPRTSFLRVAWLPCGGYLAYHLLHSLCSTWRSLPFRGVMGGTSILVTMNTFGLLVLRRVDDHDLIEGGVYKATASLVIKTAKTALFFCNLRAVGTPWQVNIATLCPKFMAHRRDASGNQSRAWWIFRTVLIVAWQYLFLDLLEAHSKSQPPEEIRKITGDDLEWPSLSLTAEQWMMRAATSYPARMGPTRIGPDFLYRSFSLLFVVLGLSRPEAWPPLFGSISNSSTLRGSWAGLTHRLVRQPLSTISNFFIGNVLGLPLKSFIGRYLTVFFVFLLSGIFHALIEILDDDGIPRHEQWQVVLYYVLCSFGVMFEDAVQALWRRVAGTSRKSWHKVFGFIWVMVFFTIVHPIFLYPALRQGIERKELVPIDVVTKMGMPVAAGVVLVGGILVKLTIGGEI